MTYDENYYADLQREEEATEKANNNYQQAVLDKEDDRAYEAECNYAPSEPY